MQLACQTITYGDGQHEILDSMLAEIAAAGYHGVEIGFARLVPMDNAHLVDILEIQGLELVASHCGGNLEQPNEQSDGRPLLEVILERLARTETRILNYSGGRYEGAEQLSKSLAMLNRAAQRCADDGVHLCYHNHWWEIENDGFLIRKLFDEASPELGFCPDIGWITRGGMAPDEVLEMLSERLGIVHLKDIDSATSDPVEFVEFGEGVVPLKDALSWLRAHCPELWSVAEQDRSKFAPREAVKRNVVQVLELARGLEE